MGTVDKLLECNVQACGTQFQIDEVFKDGTFPPGSMGFLSYIMGSDHNNPNIVFQQVITTRRGKTGKSRINNNMILSPIFKIPGVEPEAMFPKSDDTKHFVDITVESGTTAAVIGADNPIDETYLAWLLARCLFVRELDKAIYPPDHQIMSTVNLGGSKQVYVWPKDKLNTLKKFTDQLERFHNDGAIDAIAEEWSNPETKGMLLDQLRSLEAALIIPRMEYQRKVSQMLIEALAHVSTFVNDKANKVADKDDINKSIKLTKKAIVSQRDSASAIINNRLATIQKNRKLLDY